MNITEKMQKKWKEMSKFPFQSGLGRTLLLGFLAISLIPLVVVSLVSYRISYNSLHEDAMNSLSAVSKLKKEYVESYFAERLKDITLQAQLNSNAQTLEFLKDYFVKSGIPAGEFVKSDRWKMVVNERCKDLKNFKITYGYEDLFFIDNEGNILYSVMADNDLGGNIFNGRYSNTLFGKACRRAFAAGKPVFSDFEFYEPAGNSVVGFFVHLIVNNKGEKIGLLANSIPVDEIDAIMQERTGLGRSGESYLIGKDLAMRSNSRFLAESTILKKVIDTDVTREWIKQNMDSDHGNRSAKEIKASIYNDYRGIKVLGIYNDMEIAGVNLALVAEIDEAEAFRPVKMLKKIVIGLLFITVITVVFISVIVTKYLVVPIKRLAELGHRVALRDLTHSEEIEITEQIAISRNEIGQMGKSFKEIVESFRQVIVVCEAVSIGDFHKLVKVKSENDRLGKAVNQMAENLRFVVKQVNNIAKGDYSVEIVPRSDQDHLGQALFDMTATLKTVSAENEKKIWLRNHRMELNDRMRGEQDVSTLCKNIISYMAECLNVQIGAIYLADREDEGILRLMASYAYTKRKNLSNEFKPGDGLVGQAALEKQIIIVSNVPDDYIRINSGLGEAVPHYIIVMPVLHEKAVVGVMELGAFNEFTGLQLEFLNLVAENIAIAINSAESRTVMERLLEETQRQAERLETQQEELRQTNEALEDQTKALKESEAHLQVQQEELRQTNEELEERTKELEKQKEDVKRKNNELEVSREDLKRKADALELSSKYKSEFLANMSHELRTPLNSILILSKILSDNKECNFTEKQVELAKTIHSAGADLLTLINDILDLSKVEAGKMRLHIELVELHDLANNIVRKFKPVAEQKGLDFRVVMSDGLPHNILTDRQRLDQIIKNFLSNAVKFTDKGGVTLSIYRPKKDVDTLSVNLDPDKTIAISVTDTGIGIPKEKQMLIFEAFQQADGTTSRKYGGTGLGLSISRELVRVLGGKIVLKSEVGKGSIFTIYLPEETKEKQQLAVGSWQLAKKTSSQQPEVKAVGSWQLAVGKKTVNEQQVTSIEQPVARSKSSWQLAVGKETSDEQLATSTVTSNEQPADVGQFKPPDIDTDLVWDDRRNVRYGDRSILVIEDDSIFARIIFDLAHERGFKCLVAESGETGLYMADYYKPSAIILDIGLPGMDGFSVMERLKDNPSTRHIPVNFISGSEKTIDAMRMGAIGYLTKPVTMEMLNSVFGKIETIVAKKVKKLLIVEDDASMRKSIIELLGNGDITTTGVSTGHEAYDLLKTGEFDCLVLDIGLSDMSGSDLLDKIRNDKSISYIPVIIYTGRELSEQEELMLNKYADSIIIKGVKSPERLLDETALFLHRVESDLPAEKQRMLRTVHNKDAVFEDKKILLVDDDMRNVFALTHVIEEKGMKVIIGKNGRHGLECLDKNPDIDLVLMDIMMPEMDGYEAMKEIRRQIRFKNLPIIAITAKAMAGDRNKCIEAGASDYLSKPIDTDKLLSLFKVWLYK